MPFLNWFPKNIGVVKRDTDWEEESLGVREKKKRRIEIFVLRRRVSQIIAIVIVEYVMFFTREHWPKSRAVLTKP
jgi:hypothetical protein